MSKYFYFTICIILTLPIFSCIHMERINDDNHGQFSLSLSYFFQDGDYENFYKVEENQLYLSRKNRINGESAQSNKTVIKLSKKSCHLIRLQGERLMNINNEYIDHGVIDGINWRASIILNGVAKTIVVSNLYVPEMDTMINLINAEIPKGDKRIPLTAISKSSK